MLNLKFEHFRLTVYKMHSLFWSLALAWAEHVGWDQLWIFLLGGTAAAVGGVLSGVVFFSLYIDTVMNAKFGEGVYTLFLHSNWDVWLQNLHISLI